MHRAIRTQVDDKFDQYSERAAKEFPEPTLTRQEGKDDADINVLLRRYGIGIPRPVSYGVQDFNTDLQQAYDAINNAETFWLRLPKELRDKYPTWVQVLEAVERGEISKETLAEKKPDVKVPEPIPEVRTNG